MLAMAIVDGAWIFLAVVVLFLLGAIHGLYTRSGSGIGQRPYGNRYGGAPGAKGPSSIGSDRFSGTNYGRGTR